MDEILNLEQIKSAMESLIFTTPKPLLIDDLKKLFDTISPSQIREIVESIKKDLETRSSGVRIVEIAGGFLMVTAPENSTYIKNYYKIKHTEKLSGPSLETLAIIAYKQPLTRIDIEVIRGVNVDGVTKSLLEKNLIRIVGRKEIIGRPFVYGTTRVFLDYFGLKSLSELPKIEEFAQQDMIDNMKLVSGEGEITPLDADEEKAVTESQMQSENKVPESAPEENLKEAIEENVNQQDT